MEDIDMIDAQNWIEDITGEQFGDVGFHEKLKNGVLLCKLINSIKPGTIVKVSESRFVFKNIENVWKFCNACKDMGVPDSILPQAPDFYEGKNVPKMVSCLHYLGGWLMTYPHIAPDFNGPYIGKKVAVASPRNFSTEQRAAQRLAASTSGITSGSHGVMERVDTTSSLNIGFGNKASGAGSGTATMISAGSSNVMEKVDTTSSLNIGFGNKASGAGSSEATMISAGSSKIMEKVDSNVHDINFGNNVAGAGSGGPTALSTGSSQVMEKSDNGVAAYDINFGNKAAGAGTGGPTAISTGSSQVMEKSDNGVAAYDIGFGNKAAGAGTGGPTAISTGSSQVMEKSENGVASYDIGFGNNAVGSGSSEPTMMSVGSSEYATRESVPNDIIQGGDTDGHSFAPETPSGVPMEVQQDAETQPEGEHTRRPSMMDRLFANSEEEKVVDPSVEYDVPEPAEAEPLADIPLDQPAKAEPLPDADPFGDSVAMPAPAETPEDPFAAPAVDNPFEDGTAAAEDTDPFAPSSDPFADAPILEPTTSD